MPSAHSKHTVPTEVAHFLGWFWGYLVEITGGEVADTLLTYLWAALCCCGQKLALSTLSHLVGGGINEYCVGLELFAHKEMATACGVPKPRLKDPE